MTEIARGLSRSRFEAHVGCFRSDGIRKSELLEAGIPVVEFPVTSFLSPSAAKSAWDLVRYIRQHEIRLVHTFDYPLTVFAAPIARAATEAVVVTSQRAHRELLPGVYAKIVPVTDRIADAIVVNCEFLRRHLVHDYDVPADKVKLCYNGLDLDSFRPGESIHDEIAPGSLVIGTVCALRPEKGLPLLIDAFAQVRATMSNVQLLIVGSGEMELPLKAHAAKLGIAEACVFRPATRSVQDWLRAIDIFVLPSLSEALSNSLIEAMASGCCSVASNVGGNPELIESGQRGLLFERGNVDALVEALRQLIESPALRQEMASKGIQFVRQRLSLSASVACMESIYSSLLEDR